MLLASTLIPAQENSPESTENSAGETSPPGTSPNTNPTRRLIIPRQQQSEDRQTADQLECFEWTCDQTDWDPYQAYEILVDQGYAVALTPKEMERGLISLAAYGAETGAVAGEILGDPERGAEIGAAISIARGLIHSNYLIDLDDPQARKVVSRFERDLQKWDRKYAGCLSRKGYQVPPR